MFQLTPIFSDVCRYYSYPVATSGTNPAVVIDQPFATSFGYVTLKPQNMFVAMALRCVTNYDNVGGVYATADSDAILAQPFAPNNFTVTVARGNNNDYSNQPMTQAEICSSGYRAGKVFPLPVAYGPRFTFKFSFTDTTGLFLLTATSAGEAVPLRIQMFLEGYHVPQEQWNKFCQIFPSFGQVFATP